METSQLRIFSGRSCSFCRNLCHSSGNRGDGLSLRLFTRFPWKWITPLRVSVQLTTKISLGSLTRVLRSFNIFWTLSCILCVTRSGNFSPDSFTAFLIFSCSNLKTVSRSCKITALFYSFLYKICEKGVH